MSSSADEQKPALPGVDQLQSKARSSQTILADHKRLAEWVSQYGGFIHPSLQMAHHASKGFHAVVADGETLPADTRIASCPMSVTLSVLNVLNITPFEQHGTKFPGAFLRKYQHATDMLQTFFLMEQHVLGEKSYWALYLKTLPSIEEVDDLQFDSDSNIAWIRGTNLEAAIASQARNWSHQFEEGNEMLKRLDWPSATRGAYSYRMFRWASTIFGSRSFTSQVLEDTAPADKARPMGRQDPDHKMLSRLFSDRFAVLLPLLDILNHKPAAVVEWQARIDYVGLQIHEYYTSGQEVFNNYGPRDNEGLLMSYGFVIENNPFEHVLISINAHHGTPLEMARSWPQDERSNENYNCYIFDLAHPIVKESKFLERALFSYDLLDSISVMVSNDRELQAMTDKRQTLMSKYLPSLFEDHRNLLATVAQIMLDCSARAQRIEETDPTRPGVGLIAQTQKQKNALIYRRKQVSILKAAAGICAFSLLNASTEQSSSDLLLSMQLKIPTLYTSELADICTRVSCVAPKNELFTAASLIELFPSPTANSVRACLRAIENAILDSVPSHLWMSGDQIKTSFTITLSALCITARSRTQLPYRLSTWFAELAASYPPEDPNWHYVPSPGPYVPGEEPPPALMTLLGALPKVTASLAPDSMTKSWLVPQMICWAWNVMEEEGVRVPIEIERFMSEDPTQVTGATGFMIYCRQ